MATWALKIPKNADKVELLFQTLDRVKTRQSTGGAQCDAF